jgi:hypothetical protein
MNPCYAAPADDFDECEAEEDYYDDDDYEDWPSSVKEETPNEWQYPSW